ncbi:putative membrane protein DUF2339 [Tumebacillus sp. BK434]|uniref:DUF2339 domain-containing protein n=1 Tax=Tumebacillus sp. BK434 TaxID=2512169 RepID=UPI0010D62849|nr:DUF2339 domain-containing protein [Tumebacillus sp. BK434]TCP56019.1 putative membrane protein DUF2339 [Tumebacillus sp. BK434]
MSQDDKLKRLEAELQLQKQEIQSLQKQIHLLSGRIEDLQAGAGHPGPHASAPGSAAEPDLLPIGTQAAADLAGATAPAAGPVGQESKTPGAQPQQVQEHPPPTDWEHLLGRVWLPRIFVLVLLLGVIWGFQTAVAAGVLTEPVRCLLGALAGGLFLWLGDRQARAQRTALGNVLLGGALAVWLLTVFAAHMLYGLLSSGAAFSLNVLIVLAGIACTERYRSQTLGILTALAGMLVPFLLKSETPNTLLFVSFEVFSSLIYLGLALRHNFRALYVFNFLFFHAALLFFGIATGSEATQTIGYGVLIHHLALLAGMIVRKAQDSRFLTLFTSAAFTMGWWYVLFAHDPVKGALYTWLLLLLTVLYAALAYYYRRQQGSARFAVSLTISSFALMFYLLRILAGPNEAIALLLEGACLFALALHLRARVQSIMSVAIFTLGASVTIFDRIPQVASGQTLAWIVMILSLAAVLTFTAKVLRSREADGEEIGFEWSVVRALWVANAMLLLVFLTRITGLLTDSLSNDIQHFAVSAVWALYAVAVILLGTVRRSALARIAGMVLLFITLLKLLVFDLPTVSVLIRALLFIGLGLIGLAISRVFYKK